MKKILAAIVLALVASLSIASPASAHADPPQVKTTKKVEARIVNHGYVQVRRCTVYKFRWYTTKHCSQWRTVGKWF